MTNDPNTQKDSNSTDKIDTPQEVVDKISEEFTEFTNTKDETGEHDANDIAQNKSMAILCYLFLLWLIPYFVGDAREKSPFLRFHLQQGLTFLIFSAVGGVLSNILVRIPLIGWIFSLVISLAILVFAIIGIVNVVNGKAKELPIIGGIHLLK